MNMLQNLNLVKMFIALVLLGAYSASMYKLTLTQALQTHAVDTPISESTASDVEKIRAVVKPRVEAQGSTTYLPGIACVVEAGPGTTIEMMEEYFSTCISDHRVFMAGSEVIILD